MISAKFMCALLSAGAGIMLAFLGSGCFLTSDPCNCPTLEPTGPGTFKIEAPNGSWQYQPFELVGATLEVTSDDKVFIRYSRGEEDVTVTYRITSKGNQGF